MRSVDLFVVLAAYALTSFVVLAFEALHRRSWMNAIGVLTAAAAIAAAGVIGFQLEPGRSAIDVLLRIATEHRARHLVAAALGAGAALAWAVRLLPLLPGAVSGDRDAAAPRRRRIWPLADQLVVAASIAAVAGGAGLLLWNSLFDIQTRSRTRAFAPGFVIDEIAEIPFLPLRLIVAESGDLYVNYFWTENNATHGGGIIKLTRDPVRDTFSQKTVASSDVLFRTLGLAERNGDLYVSRSGYHAEARAGKITYVDAGVVTQLKDLNHDEYFEYYDDILTGIPGGRGPDIQHQNDGIAFGPDGSLYLATGVASRGIDEHPLAGVVLKLSPDFQTSEVVAWGFRNPFGIIVLPDGTVFVTDNDVEENPGDELDHIIAGEHYGHPYVWPDKPGIEASGYREPIWVGGLNENFVGFAYADSPALPDGFRDCLYIAELSGDKVLRVAFEPDGDTFKVTSVEPFASIPTPLDVAIAKDGTIYVASRFDQKIFRIRYRGPAAAGGGSS